MVNRIFALCLAFVFCLALLSACAAEPQPEPIAEDTLVSVGTSQVSLQEYTYFYYSNLRDFLQKYEDYLSQIGLDPETPLNEQDCNYLENGGTWADFFLNQTDDLVHQVYAFSSAAQNEGMTLTDEDGQTREAYLLSLREAAKEANMARDEYLAALYGEGMTEELFSAYLDRRLLAARYWESHLPTSFTEEEYEAYYQAHKETVDRVTFCYYTLNSDYLTQAAETEAEIDDAVKSLADSFARDLSTVEEFSKRAYAYAPQDRKESFAETDAVLMQEISPSMLSGNAELSSWLYDELRAEGDVTVLKQAAGTYAVCLFVSRTRPQSRLASMRHILMSVNSTYQDGDFVSDEAEVLASIEELYALWRSGDATEESFAALVADYTDDTGSAENGGLYENFTKGYMVPSVDNWVYAEGRKPGDTGIVKSDYGYHLIYFVGYGGVEWQSECYEGMRDAASDALVSQITALYPFSAAEGYRDRVGNAF